MEKDVEKEYKQFFKNRLVNVSQKLKQETLEEMKKCLLEKDASITISADITNIKLISLMEDKGIITMENCACLASIFHRTGQSDLIEKLPRKCKYFLSCYSIKTQLYPPSLYFVEGCVKYYTEIIEQGLYHKKKKRKKAKIIVI